MVIEFKATLGNKVLSNLPKYPIHQALKTSFLFSESQSINSHNIYKIINNIMYEENTQ